MKPKKIVVCGPWMGEFGGELEHWHAYLRHLKRFEYKDRYMVSCSFPGRAAFYPFAEEFWELPEFVMTALQNREVFTRWATVVDARTGKLLVAGDEFIDKTIDWLKDKVSKAFPNEEVEFLQPHIGLHPNTLLNKQTQLYELLRVEKEVPTKDHIVIFPRQRLNEPVRNWPLDRWKQLVELFLREGETVISCGTTYESGILEINDPKFVDIHGSDLETQIAYMQTAKLAVTSLCGAVRFAAYTGTTTLTFGHRGYIDSVRIAEGKPLHENPFGTELYVATRGNSWEITPEEVFKMAKEVLQRKAL